VKYHLKLFLKHCHVSAINTSQAIMSAVEYSCSLRPLPDRTLFMTFTADLTEQFFFFLVNLKKETDNSKDDIPLA
jgi:hypothetical protein